MTPQEHKDLTNWRGKYALTPEEMYERIGDILALSYGEAAAKKICTAWSRKCEASGTTAPNRQLTLF